MAKRVAVILAGCGVYDGTEIHEASAILVHLSRAGAKVQMFAPNAEMMHVVNHCEGKPVTDKRNVMQESARIARGEVTDLAKLDVKDHDALIIPGGFGAAKNLSDWATKGMEYSVKPQVEQVIKSFHRAGKPMGMCCISPVLAAKTIPGCELTVGHDFECEKWPYANVAKSMVELGCKHVNKNVEEVHVDKKNKLVTTSAFMCNAPLHEIFDGLGIMVLYVDRDCCSSVGKGKAAAMFYEWDQLVVRLDVWHFMRRFASAVTTECHQLYGLFMGSPSVSWPPHAQGPGDRAARPGAAGRLHGCDGHHGHQASGPREDGGHLADPEAPPPLHSGPSWCSAKLYRLSINRLCCFFCYRYNARRKKQEQDVWT